METNSAEQTSTEVTPEQQQASMRAMAEMRRDAYTQLVSIHVQSLTRVLMASNGVSQLQKRQANKALVEAIEFALNFGVKDDNSIRDKGTVFAKETNNLAATLVQALDNRMLLLADNMRRQEAEESVVESNNEENKESSNAE